MAHDPSWCFWHKMQVFEYRVPETGLRFTVPVTEKLAASAESDRLYRIMLRAAHGMHATAEFRRRLAAHKTEDGEYVWREV
jgi:hypothetical protein